MKFVGPGVYSLVRWFMQVLGRLLWRMEIEGRDNIPPTGAFLLCPVHRSNIDGPLTATFTKRRMSYLAKEGMFKYGWIATLIKSMGAIRVNRGTPDRQSLHACIGVLNEGRPLVLFPEGTRCDGPIIENIEEGAAYIALRADVPVVPVGIGGSEKANPRGSVVFRPAKLRVVIGEPFKLEKRAGSERVPRTAIREGTEVIKARLQALFDQAQVDQAQVDQAEGRVNR